MSKVKVNLKDTTKVDVSSTSNTSNAVEEVITLSDSQNNKVEAMGLAVSNRNNYFSLELDNKALKEAEDDKLLTLFLDLYNEQAEREELARDKILSQTISLFKHTASKILVSSTHKRVQKESDEIIKSIVVGFGENRLYKILLLNKMTYKHYKKVFKLEKYIQKSILKDLKEETIEAQKKYEFSQENAIELWKLFIEHIRPKAQNSFINIINNQVPEIKGNTISLYVSNNINYEIIQIYCSDIVSFFMSNTNNNRIELDIIVQKNEQDDNAPKKKPVDKLKELIDKNDKIVYLIEKLSIDLEAF